MTDETRLPRTTVKKLAALEDGPVRVSGWVETVRDQKKVQFVVLRDESGAVQLVNPAVREAVEGDDASAARLTITEAISGLAQGSFVTVTGA
ncbi:OB-fold nucleic acid binding domain-containing protein, partial [Rathayibacter rathayi]